jgi:hypothetical protein
MIARYIIGRFWFGRVRSYLREQQFIGRKIEVFEGRGWLDRAFIVKGDDADVRAVDQDMRAWIKRVNEAA